MLPGLKAKNCVIAALSSAFLAFGLYHVHSFSGVTEGGVLGMTLLLADIIVAVWVLYVHLTHHTVSGWSSLMLSVWFLGSLILMAIGIVGEYVGKIFVEVKNRPRYNIEEEIF